MHRELVWSDSSLNGLFAQTARLWPGDSRVSVITVGTVVSAKNRNRTFISPENGTTAAHTLKKK